MQELLIGELDELAAKLWEDYFNKPHTPAEKKKLREEYNKVAELRNKKGNFKALILLTASTRIEKRTDEDKIILPKNQNEDVRPKQPAGTGGKIEQIIALHNAGKSKKEIIAAGFNKSTVNRQISEYIKRQSSGAK